MRIQNAGTEVVEAKAGAVSCHIDFANWATVPLTFVMSFHENAHQFIAVIVLDHVA